MRGRTTGGVPRPTPAVPPTSTPAFREALGDAGAEIVVGTTQVPDDPDAIYAYDPTLPTDRGVILLRPGKPGRRAEPAALEADLTSAGLAVLGRLTAPGHGRGR